MRRQRIAGAMALVIGAAGLVTGLAATTAGAASPTNLLECQFGADQIFDIQWNPGNYASVGLQAAGLAAPFASTAPSGPLQAGDIANDDFFQFVASTTNPGTYSLIQNDHTGALKRVIHDTGTWTAVGVGMLFYQGGGFYGTLFSTQQAFNYGDSHTFPVTNAAPTNIDALAFTDCLSYPVSQGPPTTSPPTTTPPTSTPPTSTPPTVSPTPPGLVNLTPNRLVDTRTTKNPLDAHVVREIQVAGTGDAPSDATAVVINATVLDALEAGYLTVFPCGSTPGTSTVNFSPGGTVSNSATVGLGQGGKLCVVSTAVTNFVLDVTAAHSPTRSDGGIVGVGPSRLDDTRSGAKVPAGTVHEIAVTGRAGVPSDATAVAINLTVTQPSAAGYATAFPCGSAVAGTSNVNFDEGRTVANSAVVRIGTNGKICVVASADAHFIVDVNAAFSPTSTSAGAFVPLTPTRLLDSRPSLMSPDLATQVAVTGMGGVPSSVSMVTLNVTIDAAAEDGYATVYPCGTALPLASNLNFVAGQTVANAVTVPVGADGKVCVRSTAAAGLLVDVTGYYPTAT